MPDTSKGKQDAQVNGKAGSRPPPNPVNREKCRDVETIGNLRGKPQRSQNIPNRFLALSPESVPEPFQHQAVQLLRPFGLGPVATAWDNVPLQVRHVLLHPLRQLRREEDVVLG